MSDEYICPHCKKRYDEFVLCDYCKTQVLELADFNKYRNLFNLGNEEFYIKEFEGALYFYYMACNKLPKCDALFFYKSLCYMHLDDLKNSVKAYSKALELNPYHLMNL